MQVIHILVDEHTKFLTADKGLIDIHEINALDTFIYGIAYKENKKEGDQFITTELLVTSCEHFKLEPDKQYLAYDILDRDNNPISFFLIDPVKLVQGILVTTDKQIQTIVFDQINEKRKIHMTSMVANPPFVRPCDIYATMYNITGAQISNLIGDIYLIKASVINLIPDMLTFISLYNQKQNGFSYIGVVRE